MHQYPERAGELDLGCLILAVFLSHFYCLDSSSSSLFKGNKHHKRLQNKQVSSQCQTNPREIVVSTAPSVFCGWSWSLADWLISWVSKLPVCLGLPLGKLLCAALNWRRGIGPDVHLPNEPVKDCFLVFSREKNSRMETEWLVRKTYVWLTSPPPLKSSFVTLLYYQLIYSVHGNSRFALSHRK